MISFHFSRAFCQQFRAPCPPAPLLWPLTSSNRVRLVNLFVVSVTNCTTNNVVRCTVYESRTATSRLDASDRATVSYHPCQQVPTLIIHSYICLCDPEDILLIYPDISITLPGNRSFAEIYTYVSNKLTYCP